jgi:Xaa-Pro aminopeptidase
VITKIGWDVPRFDADEGVRRYDALRAAMAADGVDGLVIAGHQGNYGDRNANLRYVANYEPWYDDEYVVLPGAGTPALFAWSEPHAEWCRKVSWIDEVIPAAQMSRGYSGKDAYPRSIAAVVRERGLGRARLGIADLETMPASVYLGLREQLPDAELVDAGELMARVRMIKSAAELEFMQEAARIGDVGVAAMRDATRVGATETEVWAACEHAMTLAGASPPSFTLMASSHRLPDKGLGLPYGGAGRTLGPGDVILNELTPSYGGYWNQLDGPIALGSISAELQRLLDVHTAMYELALREIRPGVSMQAVNDMTRAVAADMGADPAPAPTWTIAHIGLRIRDDIPPATVLEPNMTFVVQPLTQHDDGVWGGHTIGATAVVTETGCRVLNEPPRAHVV